MQKVKLILARRIEISENEMEDLISKTIANLNSEDAEDISNDGY